MSSSLNVCYGYYITGKYRYVEDSKIKFSCANGHDQLEDFKFCPLCGTKIKEIKEPITVPLGLEDLEDGDDDIQDQLYFLEYAPENTFMAISNVGAIHDVDINAAVTPLYDDGQKLEDANKFFEMHENDIAQLESIFDDVEVKYGIITYYN